MSARLFRGFIVMVMITVLVTAAACSKAKTTNVAKETAADNTPVSTASNSATDSNKESAATDPFGKYEPPIEVSVVATTGTNVLFTQGESIDNNIMTKTYRDILGIKFVNKWAVDAAQSIEKMNLSINTNTIPDISKVDLNQLARMMQNDQIQDLTEVYKQYASPLLRKAMEYGEGEGFSASSKDGKFYGMPVPVDFYENVAIMYIRQDWLDKLKLQAPKTMAEVVDVAKAFAEQDPDGNNKNDTYGIALDNSLGMGFDGIAAPFKAYRAMWFKDASGKMSYGSVQPEMKQALAQMQELYKAKAIDPEFGAKDWGKMSDDIGAGKGGIMFGAFWAPIYPLQLTKKHTPDSDWKAYPIPVGADGTIMPKRATNVYTWMVARKGMEHPEALIKSMNLWAELWIEGGKYNDLLYKEIQASEKYKGIEVHQYAKPYFFDDPGKNFIIGKQFSAAMEKDDPSLITHPDGKWKWEAYKKNDTNGWAFMKYLSESESVLASYNEKFKNQDFLGAPTETMVKRSASLNKIESETFTKIIMGKLAIDEFDKFVDQWNKLGGEKITEEVNKVATK